MSDTAARSPDDGNRDAVAFVLRLGLALLGAGYPINLIRELLLELAQQLALPEPQVYVTPTALEVTIGPLTQQHSARLVTRPGSINLGRLTQLDSLAHAVAAGMLSPQDGLNQLDSLTTVRPGSGALLLGSSYALSAASYASILGGGVSEVAAALLLGALIGLLAVLTQGRSQLESLFPPLAAFVASFLAVVLASRVHPLDSGIVTLAGLVVLLPGFALTVALQELASWDLISGTVRLNATLIIFLGLILGVALGTQLAGRAVGTTQIVHPHALPLWAYVLAALVAGLAYNVRLQVELQDTLWVILACLIAALAVRAGDFLLGAQAGAFIGALVVGLTSNLFAAVRHRPAVVMQVPGLILLVPGSLGFQGVEALFTAQTLSGVQDAFRMFLTAIALVYGIFVANLLLPAPRSGNPRR